jgi:hypothetical protein
MAAFTWKRVLPTGDLTVNVGLLPDDWLAHINTVVTARSGDSDASWEVANYASVSPKSVLLRPKDGSNGRIIFFGQNAGTPNSAAVRTATSSLLYIAFHPSSSANTPDTSWLTGQPLTGTDYIPGIPCWQMTSSTQCRLTYMDAPAGMWFLFTLGTTTGIGMTGAGMLVQDKAGGTYPTIQGTGSQTLPTEPFGQGTTTMLPTGGANNVTASTNPRLIVTYNAWGECLFRVHSQTSLTALDKLRDSTAKRAFFFPIDLNFSTQDLRRGHFGKLRQVAFGPSAQREQSLEATGSPSIYAYAHANSNASNVPAIWFTNFEV